MDGIINLHKPTGITSAKALYRVRALTGQRKSGHGGSLDPLASGVLLLCLGRGTKLVERIMDQPKVYRATARLDVTSESFDSDRPMVPVSLRGKVEKSKSQKIENDEATKGEGIEQTSKRRNVNTSKQWDASSRVCGSTSGYQADGEEADKRAIAGETLEEIPTAGEVVTALREFEGEIQQVPPGISAVKVGGQPAYKRRSGEAPLELKPRPVRIYWIHLHSYAWPTIDFEMCCGRGTYVRALIRDVGERLGTGGCLTSLVRTRVGPFAIEHAWSLEGIAAASPVVSQSTIDIRHSTSTKVSAPPYLIPLQEAHLLLSSDSVRIPSPPE